MALHEMAAKAVEIVAERRAAANEFIGLWEFLLLHMTPAEALRDSRLKAARNRYRSSRGEGTIRHS